MSSNLPPELEKLANALADLKVEAAFKANLMVTASVIELPIKNDAIAREDLLERFSVLEMKARALKDEAPVVSEFALRACLNLRHGLDAVADKSPPN